MMQTQIPSTPNVYLADYSEKAIAVFGDTKPFKSAMMNAGGKFNGSLNDPISKSRRAGWIFSKQRSNDIAQLVADINAGFVPPEAETPRAYGYQPAQTVASTPMPHVTLRIAQPTQSTTQTVVYTVPILRIGMRVKTDSSSTVYTIRDAPVVRGIIEDVVVTDPEGNEERIVIINGQWQIRRILDPHTITIVN